jgi:hypothetical protein
VGIAGGSTEFHQKNSRSPGGLLAAGSVSCVTSMINIEKTGKLLGLCMASALLSLAATAVQAAGPSPFPALKSVVVEVDTTGLAASEQAALIPILRAARQMDALYIQQVWPGSSALIRGRQSDQTSAARAELDALNFFKGPSGPPGHHSLTRFRPSSRSVTITLQAQPSMKSIIGLGHCPSPTASGLSTPLRSLNTDETGPFKWSRIVATTKTV